MIKPYVCLNDEIDRTRLERTIFWLVKTGRFIEDVENITGMDSLIRGDYMGSDEFEHGTVYASTKRVVINKDFYEFFTFEEYKDQNGDPLIVYAPAMFIDYIKANIDTFAKSEAKLKERKYSLENHMNLDKSHVLYDKTNYWHDILNDFYIFFGEDKKDLILQAVNAMREKWMDTVEVGDPHKLAKYYLCMNPDLSEEAKEYLHSKRESVLTRIFRPKK